MKKLSYLLSLFVVMIIAFNQTNAQEFVSTDPQPRNAVVEEFTGIYCQFCPLGHELVQGLIDENPGRVIAINVHTGGYSVPQNASHPDFRTEWGSALANMSGLTGYPAAQVNRQLFFQGQTTLAIPGARSNWATAANAVLADNNSPVNVAARTTYNENTREVTIEVEAYYTADVNENNKLNVAILENRIRGFQYRPGNVPVPDYLHNHVLRDLITGQWGEEITTTSQGTLIEKSYTYKIDEEWNPTYCDIVVFMTGSDNQYIYTGDQEMVTETRPPRYLVNLIDDDKYFKGATGETVQATFTIENPNDDDLDFEVTLNTDYVDQSWNVSVANSVINVPANSSKQYTIDVEVGNSLTFASIPYKVIATNIDSEALAIENEGTLGVLHSDVKYVNFIGYNDFIMAYLNAMYNNDVYKSNSAYVPLDPKAFSAYPHEMFDYIGINNSFNGRAVFGSGQYEMLHQELYPYIEDFLDNGGNVMFNAPLALNFAFGSQDQSATAQNFFNNTLGISFSKTIAVSQTSQSGTQVFQFDLEGINGDITEGMSFECNKYNADTNPYYMRFLDAITINSGSDADPIMNGSISDQTFLTGVKKQVGDGKIVFTTFGFNAFSSQQDRNTFFNAVVDWFESGAAPEGAKIESNMAKVDFGDAQANETVSESVTVTNTGDEDLTISTIVITDDAENAFEVTTTGSIIIAPGSDKMIGINFTPAEDKEYTANLVISSNAINNDELIIELVGNGVSSVKDGVAGIDAKFTVSAGPNPFADLTKVTYTVSGNTGANVEIDLIDASGNIVRNDVINSFTAPGEYTVDLNAAGLSSGTYYLIANGNGVRTQLPVVIQK